GFSHARIIVEIANTQDILTWNTKCEFWMRKQHVRYVFVIDAITGVRNTNTVGYVVAVPVAITVPNFVIDLF
ncbi:23738_t:CDS:2, partial [Gigaspora margarita]